MTGMDWTLTGVIFILLGLTAVLAGEAGIWLYRRRRQNDTALDDAALEIGLEEEIESSVEAHPGIQMAPLAGTEKNTEQKTAMERRNP